MSERELAGRFGVSRGAVQRILRGRERSATFNQASHQPGLDYSDIHPDLESARAEKDEKRARTAEAGRGETHVLAEVIELDGDGDA